MTSGSARGNAETSRYPDRGVPESNALRQAHEQLREVCARQEATDEILQLISRSPTDAQPVFDAIVRHARVLCESMFANVFRYDGELVHFVATQGWPADVLPTLESAFPARPNSSRAAGRVMLANDVIHIEDTHADPEYDQDLAVALGGHRRILGVPMRRAGVAVGAITVGWTEPGSIRKHDEELLKTFADQAVIAIENARLFREIAEKSRQLEAASRHKSEFLANMSHELRTPLNAILGFSEMLAARYFGALNEKQDEYVRDIHDSGKHLLSLINDILDLSKIEAGRMELELSEFDLPAALHNALILVKERAQRHGVALDLEIAPGLGTLCADERKFKQIMLNLLSNAVKFTPDGGSVSVAATLNDSMLEVSVADTGSGIAPEDQNAVFDEFKQVGPRSAGKMEGTGLGLSLAKRFVELHGGAIRLASAVGQGSTFSFTLPIRHSAYLQAT